MDTILNTLIHVCLRRNPNFLRWDLDFDAVWIYIPRTINQLMVDACELLI